MLRLSFMPPHLAHAVYTPSLTFAAGGHMLLYDCLHLTEQARLTDTRYGETATNTNHDGVDCMLYRMCIALTQGDRKCE